MSRSLPSRRSDRYEKSDAMVERVGRALCRYDNAQERGRFDWGETAVELRYEDLKDEYDAEARAALAAAFGEANAFL